MTTSDTPGRRPEHDAAGQDPDPTGMRDLLSTLPDPGPMPEDLVHRIELRLAVEQAHHARHGGAGSAGVIDLAAEHSRRRPGRTLTLLGAAAAGLAITTVALSQLPLGPDGVGAGSAAQYPSGEAVQDADRAAAAGDMADAAGGDSAAATEEASLLTAPEELVLLAPLGTVDVTTFGTRIHTETTAAAGQDATEPESVLTPAQAGRCWDATGAAGLWSQRSAARAELADGPVVVLLAVAHDGAVATAYLMPWACTSGAETTPIASVPVLP
ncbi:MULTISPECIES: hypothetical protein [unclassified Ornithinimicrobium]|uniref:hypothetical protein n=1 Tax=unclassified Ornithinimicrobium TaxID=2615080 RepID=UPI0038542A43